MIRGHDVRELYFGAAGLAAAVFMYFFTVYVVLRAARWVAACWQARQAAGEVAEVPEDDALAVADALKVDDFAVWESECASRPRIRRYTAQLEERAR